MLNVVRIFNREDDFNTMIKITLHQVSTTHVNLFLATVVKIIYPAMFEVSPNDTDHIHIITHPFNARFQAAHAAHQQIHFYACPRSLVEQGNKTWVHHGIDLEDEVRLKTCLCV